jgi:hypothetical protein
MHADTRYLVAYIAGRLASGKNASSVFDLEAGKHRMMTGTVTDSNINVYDFERNCHISGSGSATQWTLYDFGRAAHISLQMESKTRFKGYDYATGTFYTGTISSKNVSLYDFGSGKYYNFSL